MRRSFALAAAVLMLLFTFTPQPVTPQAKASPEPSEQAPAYTPPQRDSLTQPTRSRRPAAPASPVKLTVVHGDTYGRWATTLCGNFNAWPGIQQTNGWPEKRIPVGATVTITCAAAKAATPASTPALASTSATSSAWVHPLASGKTATSQGACWGAARVGHTHKGVDLLQPSNTPIRAVAAGTIKLVAYSGTAGNYVIVAHAGNIFSRYMHLRVPSPLAQGTKVLAGQQIGVVGATGNAQGPHLHFEILQGGPSTRYAINPAVFMRGKGINIGC